VIKETVEGKTKKFRREQHVNRGKRKIRTPYDQRIKTGRDLVDSYFRGTESYVTEKSPIRTSSRKKVRSPDILKNTPKKGKKNPWSDQKGREVGQFRTAMGERGGENPLLI